MLCDQAVQSNSRRRGFFPTKVFFSATTLLDLVVLLTHVGGLTGGDSWCQLNISVDRELSGRAPGKDCPLPLRAGARRTALGRPTTKAKSGYCPEALKLGLAGALWRPEGPRELIQASVWVAL